MTRRVARVTQCDLDRALRAAAAHRARSGEAWRVRVAVDGTIIIEPQPAATEDAGWPIGAAGPALGRPGEAMF